MGVLLKKFINHGEYDAFTGTRIASGTSNFSKIEIDGVEHTVYTVKKDS